MKIPAIPENIRGLCHSACNCTGDCSGFVQRHNKTHSDTLAHAAPLGVPSPLSHFSLSHPPRPSPRSPPLCPPGPAGLAKAPTRVVYDTTSGRTPALAISSSHHTAPAKSPGRPE